MATKKTKQPQPHTIEKCKICNEKVYFQSDLLCSLRVKDLDELGVPAVSSLCENVKECSWFREDKSGISV